MKVSRNAMVKAIMETRNVSTNDATEIVDFIFKGFHLDETDVTDIAAFDEIMSCIPAYLRDEIRHGLQIFSVTPVTDEKGRVCDYIADFRFVKEAKEVKKSEFNPYRWIMAARKCNIREAILVSAHADIIAKGNSETFRFIIESMSCDEIIEMADAIYHPDFDEKDTLYGEYSEYTYNDPETSYTNRIYDDCKTLAELYRAYKTRPVNKTAYNIKRYELERAVDCNELTDAIYAISTADKVKLAKIKRRLIDITYNKASRPDWMSDDRLNRLWKTYKHTETLRK